MYVAYQQKQLSVSPEDKIRNACGGGIYGLPGNGTIDHRILPL